MKKLFLATAIATVALSAQAEKTPFPEYSDEERLELICTIDGIPNEQIAFDIRPTQWEREYSEDGWTRENEIDVTVNETSYVNRNYSSSQKGNFTMIFSYTKRVDRVTGAYEMRSFQGNVMEYFRAVQDYNSTTKWDIKKGTCKPGKHITEAQF